MIVVCGHVWTEYPIVGYVAVFFVIAGYLWSDKRSFRTKRATVSAFSSLPYVSWLIIVGSIAFIVKAAGGASPLELAKLVANYILGGSRIVTPLTAYWFLDRDLFCDGDLPISARPAATLYFSGAGLRAAGDAGLSLCRQDTAVPGCRVLLHRVHCGWPRPACWIEASIPMAPYPALVVLVSLPSVSSTPISANG